mmetsp:Transcript_19373/g.28465  ORF Transcript_19373/g.28465 Transcript_19373/m.28465 type:complete len:164 (+) Transcript_19373:326-817(+)
MSMMKHFGVKLSHVNIDGVGKLLQTPSPMSEVVSLGRVGLLFSSTFLASTRDSFRLTANKCPNSDINERTTEKSPSQVNSRRSALAFTSSGSLKTYFVMSAGAAKLAKLPLILSTDCILPWCLAKTGLEFTTSVKSERIGPFMNGKQDAPVIMGSTKIQIGAS